MVLKLRISDKNQKIKINYVYSDLSNIWIIMNPGYTFNLTVALNNLTTPLVATLHRTALHYGYILIYSFTRIIACFIRISLRSMRNFVKMFVKLFYWRSKLFKSSLIRRENDSVYWFIHYIGEISFTGSSLC